MQPRPSSYRVGMPPYDMLGDTPMLRETQARLADTGVSVLDVEFLRFEPQISQGIPEGFPGGGCPAGRAPCSCDEHRAARSSHARALLRAVRSRATVQPARLP